MNKLSIFICALFRLVFVDRRTGEVSHTKFWSNVGYACMCYTFVYAVMFGTKVDVMIWALFGVIVVGNNTVLKLMNRNNINSTNKADEESQ